MPDERQSADSQSEVPLDGAQEPRDPAPGTPRWVWALALIAVALIVGAIAAQLLFGVQHGPGLHG